MKFKDIKELKKQKMDRILSLGLLLSAAIAAKVCQDNFVLNNNGSYLYYVDDFYTEDEATELMTELHDTLPWDWTFYEIDGVKVRGPRQMAWFAEGKDWNYQFSKNHVPGLLVQEWTPTLLKIKKRAEDFWGTPLNSVLANLYLDASEHSAWHSDDDPWLGYPDPTDIVSMSFGHSREFAWRPKDAKESVDTTMLTHGSLVIMGGEFQRHYQHSVPAKDFKQTTYRINLTFRNIKYPERRPEKSYWHS